MISKELCSKIINVALESGADFAEVFVEKRNSSSMHIAENLIESSSSSESIGVGIRIFNKDFQTYGYTNIIDENNLIKTAKNVAQALQNKRQLTAAELNEVNYDVHTKCLKNSNSIAKSDKASFLKEASIYAYEASSSVSRAEANLIEYNQDVIIANSEGVFAEDSRARTRFMQDVMVIRDEQVERDGNNFGASQGWEIFDDFDSKLFANQIVENALLKLDAIDCPSGVMPVVINNHFGGVIFHEACGHGLEAVSIAKKTSVFTDKIGQMIANPLVSAMDDGTIANAWGSLNIDDEGTPTQKNLLIENGVLKSYLVDKFNGRKIDMQSTGSSRRQSYIYMPTARMNNTFIMPGKSSFNDIIANTEKGLFASKMNGGSVNTTTGEFNFSVDQAFLVENGKITQQVRGAKLIGKGHEVLKDIDMVGDNLSLACGVCGASSGSVPTTVGQPTIRVSKMIVGGKG